MARRKSKAVVEDEAGDVEEVLEIEARIADDKLVLQWWTPNGIRCRDEMKRGDRVQVPGTSVVLVLA